MYLVKLSFGGGGCHHGQEEEYLCGGGGLVRQWQEEARAVRKHQDAPLGALTQIVTIITNCNKPIIPCYSVWSKCSTLNKNIGDSIVNWKAYRQHLNNIEVEWTAWCSLTWLSLCSENDGGCVYMNLLHKYIYSSSQMFFLVLLWIVNTEAKFLSSYNFNHVLSVYQLFLNVTVFYIPIIVRLFVSIHLPV